MMDAQKSFLLLSFIITAGCFFIAVAIVLSAVGYIRKKISYKLERNQQEEQFQKQLLAAAITSQETERKRMARDLHDDVGPLLSLASLYLDEVTNLNIHGGDEKTKFYFTEARKHINAAIEQAKRITYDMMPYAMEHIGFLRTIGGKLEGLATLKNIKTSHYFQDPRLRLESDQEIMMFRVLQESINNIIKHSNASFIHLSQYISGNCLKLELRHDGEGLDQQRFESLRKEHRGMGLKNISSRLQTGGGSLHFNKEDDVFITTFTLPMKRKKISADRH